MTDPNMPPPERTPEPAPTNTTINVQPERRGGGGSGMAFVLGGLVVLVLVIGAFVYFGGRTALDTTKDVDVDINLPKMETPKLPEAPKLPDNPITPPAEPAN